MTSECKVQSHHSLDETDLRLIRATEAGLPLVAQPYHTVAEQLNLPVELVLSRLQAMLASGVIRRIAAVPNHYRIGYAANGMTVWDVDDSRISDLGEKVGALEFVSHCYQRPRLPGFWNYNLFAMVHGHDRQECRDQAEIIKNVLAEACRGWDILFSKKILKKTGFRSKGSGGG